MRKAFYLLVTVLALGVLFASRFTPTVGRAVAQTTVTPAAPTVVTAPAVGTSPAVAATPSEVKLAVTGDLVIDFLGAQRGYVEPCG